MMPVVGADLSQRLVSDELWESVAPLLPSFAARLQGGGTAPCDERAVFTAVVYVLTSGCAWRHLPPAEYGSWKGVYTRLRNWVIDGTWERVFTALLAQADAEDDVDWIVAVDSTIVRVHQHAAGTCKRGPLLPNLATTRSGVPAVG